MSEAESLAAHADVDALVRSGGVRALRAIDADLQAVADGRDAPGRVDAESARYGRPVKVEPLVRVYQAEENGEPVTALVVGDGSLVYQVLGLTAEDLM